MGELIITTNGMALGIAALPEAVGIALVILSIGAAAAAVAYAITRYTDIDLQIELKAQDLISALN